MTRRWFLCLGLAGALPILAQDELSIDDLLRQGREWAKENLDERVVTSLDQIDDEKVGGLLRHLQQQLGGEYVLDLAALRETATRTLEFLEANEATTPSAAWLRTRLDYFEVAEELQRTLPSAAPTPDLPTPPRTHPTAPQERAVWKKQLERRPAPTGSSALVSRLKPMFAASGIPRELVWLAEVESSFDVKAVSPAGAAGLFQLMPATARSLGLSLSPQDERLDPDKSASAAAKYLAYLFGRFRDWPLSLAAYNCGEGRLRSLMDKHQAKTFDAVSARLPAETQLYVPKIEAVIQRREGKALSGLPAPKP
ncbi:MAG: lytic transglycosylase domain-containing protein [Limisphaerales bacterium]